MRVIADVEANGLTPDKIWCVVAKDIDTGEFYEFVSNNAQDFSRFSRSVSLWVGHNFLGFDLQALANVWGCGIDYTRVVDTLVLSRLVDATLDKHSLEAWGQRLGKAKPHTDITDWSTYDPRMLERCRADVEINYLLFKRFEKYLSSPRWQDAIKTEHFIAYHCQVSLHKNGFAFDFDGAVALKEKIDEELVAIDTDLKKAFPPRTKLVREYTPRLTKFGTVSRASVPRGSSDLSAYSSGATFSALAWEPFNPGSPKQIVERLNEAGWKPTEKTKGHKLAEKAVRELKRARGYRPTRQAEIAALEARLAEYKVLGWQVCEENLNTLPPDAPEAAHKLARRLLLASRSSTLTTWMEAYDDATKRIHGSFNHIEPWTQRMSHVRPNMGNIPKFDAKQPTKTPYSDKMRALWQAGPERYLVGVDAESIQLRIFGHYINDKGFINALVSGRKEDQTDPHSLNQQALGPVCKSRDVAKTFIYAWLLGAGINKISQILGCSHEEAQIANDNFLEFYPGLKLLKQDIIPYDAARGYFEGFDGRYVKIFGDDFDSRRHFTLAGYLQNGEAVIMKRAVQIWLPKLEAERIPFWWVNFVHDEWQTETVRDMETAKYVATTQADAIRQVGIDLGLNCPMAGSVLNTSGKLAIGDTWMDTH